MATIECPICGVKLMESDPSGQMNHSGMSHNCRCDHDQIVYIATDSDVEGIALFDDYGEEADFVQIDEINRKLGTSFERSVQAYHPIKAQDLIDERLATWYDGCECFGSFDEPGCYSCAIQHPRWIAPVEIHLIQSHHTWDEKTNTREQVVGFVGDDLLAFDGVHLQHGALWTTDAIPEFGMAWKQLTRRLMDENFCTLNRRQVG